MLTAVATSNPATGGLDTKIFGPDSWSAYGILVIPLYHCRLIGLGN